MGRHPKPVERKRLTGNPGKRELPDPADVPDAPPAYEDDGLLPSPPEGLEGVGYDTWKRALTLGHAWIASTDLNLLTRYCEGLEEREDLKTLVAQNGYTTIGSQGQEVLSAEYRALRDLENQLTKYESLLGFTPADRTKIGAGEVKQGKSKLETFFAGS